jgi:hypothetical protein
MLANNRSAQRALIGAAGALLTLSAVATAQQANASAAAYGMGGNYTAQARGYNAVAWNPANLGLPGNPGFSLAILAGSVNPGLDPIDANSFADFAGKYLPATTRQSWLDQVTTSKGETGSADGGITWLAASFGSLGLQVSSAAYGNATMNPDAFEALMFGNAGRTGTAKDLHLSGSNFRFGSFTTAAASWGMSFGGDGTAKPDNGAFALGVTGKFVVGHVMAMAEDNGSATSATNVALTFPIVHTNFSSSDATNAGSGFGADIGAAWNMAGWKVGATVQNVLNTFAWDGSKLRSRAGTATFDGNTNTTNFKEAAFSAAPASIRQDVDENKFKPTVNVGIAREYGADVTIAIDGRQQLGDDNSILIGPKTQVGVGAEYRGLGMLPLRGGVSYITGGMAYSGGVGLKVGAYELGLGASYRSSTEIGKGLGVMFSLISIH